MSKEEFAETSRGFEDIEDQIENYLLFLK